MMNTIDQDTLTSAVEKLTQLQAELKPYMKALSAADRQALPKMGDGSVAFVEQAHQYGQTYGELVPAFMDFDGMTSDLELFNQLSKLAQIVNPLASDMNDTMLAAGSGAYTAALAIYRNAKNAKRMNVQSAKAIHDKLAQRFSKIRRSAQSTAPAVAENAAE